MYGHQTQHAHDKSKVQNLAPLNTKNYLSNCRYRPLSAIKSFNDAFHRRTRTNTLHRKVGAHGPFRTLMRTNSGAGNIYNSASMLKVCPLLTFFFYKADPTKGSWLKQVKIANTNKGVKEDQSALSFHSRLYDRCVNSCKPPFDLDNHENLWSLSVERFLPWTGTAVHRQTGLELQQPMTKLTCALYTHLIKGQLDLMEPNLSPDYHYSLS